MHILYIEYIYIIYHCIYIQREIIIYTYDTIYISYKLKYQLSKLYLSTLVIIHLYAHLGCFNMRRSLSHIYHNQQLLCLKICKNLNQSAHYHILTLWQLAILVNVIKNNHSKFFCSYSG